MEAPERIFFFLGGGMDTGHIWGNALISGKAGGRELRGNGNNLFYRVTLWYKLGDVHVKVELLFKLVAAESSMSVGGEYRLVWHHSDELNTNSFPSVWVRPVNMLHHGQHTHTHTR